MRRINDRVYRDSARAAEAENAQKKAKLGALRPQNGPVDGKHGAPWSLDRLPR